MENKIIEKITQLENLINKHEVLLKQVLNVNEAADYLDMSKSHLYKLTSRKEIPFYCPQGKRLYFKKDELDQWLTRNRSASLAELETRAANYLFNSK
ncbi:helix-turn-helix domain-containing protein [Tenacibaculum maritimum]|nr:helix-turn-helix domain-containing protein [Tenacibaculum maritimum]MDB0603089.1 helix-turn-helix domain-containing protein [Tenacibaculum maritimum]MDB0611659.1 helix-turn-helix domain-containing protein [Tenacibaculum maritimum]